MIFFAGSGDKFDDDYILDAEMARLSREDAIFIRVNAVDLSAFAGMEDEEEEETLESVIPVERIKQSNLRAAYEVTKDGTFVVCDWFGNEFFRLAPKPKSSQVKSSITQISDLVESAVKKMTKTVEGVETALDEDDLRNAVRGLFKVFKMDKVGYEPYLRAVDLYGRTIADGRNKIGEFEGANDKEALKDLARVFKRTELEPEIEEALARLAGTKVITPGPSAEDPYEIDE